MSLDKLKTDLIERLAGVLIAGPQVTQETKDKLARLVRTSIEEHVPHIDLRADIVEYPQVPGRLFLHWTTADAADFELLLENGFEVRLLT